MGAVVHISYSSGYDSCIVSCEELGWEWAIDSNPPPGVDECFDDDFSDEALDDYLDQWWEAVGSMIRDNEEISHIIDSECPSSPPGVWSFPIPRAEWLSEFAKHQAGE